MSAPDANLRAQLAQLQAELASRRSIVHYAHGAVSLFAALIFAGAAAKYFYDQFVLLRERAVAFGLVFVAISATLLVYSAARFVLGYRRMKREAVRYEEMMAVRTALKLDDPSALLPR